LEKIDIGGPVHDTRCGKNFKDVVVAGLPKKDYGPLTVAQLPENQAICLHPHAGNSARHLPPKHLKSWRINECAIAPNISLFQRPPYFPGIGAPSPPKTMRYGENPHQDPGGVFYYGDKKNVCLF